MVRRSAGGVLPYVRRVLAAGVLSASTLGHAAAQIRADMAESLAPRPPRFHALRADDDFRAECPAFRRGDTSERLKCIAVGADGRATLAFGGEVRVRAERFVNGGWGDEAPTDDYLLQRYMLHADLRAAGRLRAFAQLKSGLSSQRIGGPRPADADRIDLHQLFVDVPLRRGARDSVSLRVGRQELAFGGSRLVSVREGPNVRQSFDGVRLGAGAAGWRVDALAVAAVPTNLGAFDDAPTADRTLWGVYAVRTLAARRRVDVYLLGYDRKVAHFGAATGAEHRRSVGTRWSGVAGAWDYDYEAVGQWGRFGATGIRAWLLATGTGCRFARAPASPRLGFEAGAASGDRRPGDGRLNTFNAMFPSGAYFSEADLLGPADVVVARPSLALHPAERFTLTPDVAAFWRQSPRDGVYGVPGNLLRPGGASRARYVGTHANVEAEYELSTYVSANATYLHFFPGRFLRETPPDRPVTYVATWATLKF